MSWSGFKKALNRAGNQVLLKAGHIDESVDIEYEYAEKRFRAMELALTLLHKDLKSYKESLRTLATAQAAVGDALAGFYEGAGHEKVAGQEKATAGNDAEEGVGHIYRHAAHAVGASLAQLEQPYLQTVLNPLERFNSYYVDVNEAIKKRSHKKLDYDALRAKVARLPELQPQAEAAEEAFATVNEQLKEELPKFVESRTAFLDPLFEAFVKLQLRYFSDAHAQMEEAAARLDAQTRQDYLRGELELRLDGVLGRLKELNIAL